MEAVWTSLFHKSFIFSSTPTTAFVSWVAAVYYQELLQSMSLLIYHTARSSENQKDIYFKKKGKPFMLDVK